MSFGIADKINTEWMVVHIEGTGKVISHAAVLVFHTITVLSHMQVLS